MKPKLLFAVLATFLLLDQPIIPPFLQSSQAADSFPPTKGEMQGFILSKHRQVAPEVPFFDGQGNIRYLKDFKGQVILVNFWATWCAPCIKEMPDLNELEAALGSDDFKVVAISQDLLGVQKAEPFLRERLKLEHLDLFIDKRTKLGRAFGVKALPVTFLIDRDGRVVGHYTGATDWASDDAKAMINHLVHEPSPP